VVAEGVENIQQLELLREMRCDLIQGYYFYKPMAAADIQRLLSGGNNPPHPGAHRPSSDPTSASNGCH
jgi:EAL domain-containing protein (putative c-di-GMP-specific phosphodiesterase class I)